MDSIRIKAGNKLSPPFAPMLPTSKSISNRLLIMHALSDGLVSFANLSEAEDTVMLRSILTNHLTGNRKSGTYYCGNAGTVLRFLTSYFASQEGTFTLTCSEEMKNRPVYPLVDALREAGSEIEYLKKDGFPPLRIKGRKVLSPVKATIDGSMSSQFISALLLSGFRYGLELKLKGKKVSWPYVKMTLKLISACKIKYQHDSETILIPPQTPGNVLLTAETDWSSAAPWYVYTALQEKNFSLTIKGLQRESIQGDSALPRLFNRIGVKTTFRKADILIKKNGDVRGKKLKLHMHNYPDLVPAMLAACAATGNSIKMTGVEHLRIKESDRIQSMKNELAKLGSQLEIISPGELYLKPAESDPSENIMINTYNDHRIAMAFAPLAYKYPLIIENPDCVAKSYPSFWSDFKSAGFSAIREPAK